MIVSDLTAHASNFGNARTILDAALAGSTITTTQYNTYYPVVDNIYTKSNNALPLLTQTIGHKDSGNFTVTSDMFDNPDNTMTEIVKNTTKYNVSNACATSIVSAVNDLSSSVSNLGLLQAITVPIFVLASDIMTWCDSFASQFTPLINAISTSISSVTTNMTIIKDAVKLFIDNLVNTTNLIVHDVLNLSPCLPDIGTQVLQYKSPADVTFINSLNTGNKSQIIADKIATFKI